MELATIEKLTALNRAFYEAHAEAFADSRPRLAPGIGRVLAAIQPGARVLEVGCGDGKVGRWLAKNTGGFYLGIDASAGMVARARQYSEEEGRRKEEEERNLLPPSFFLADITSFTWTTLLPPAPFDWILAFATFHHLPGYATRARVLQTLARHLAPGGEVVLSNWQFTRSARLMRRVMAWATIGLAENDVEPGDALLAWERGGQQGVRYVHVLNEAEARSLAAGAGLEVAEVFQSDGGLQGTKRLTEYVRMRNPIKL